MGMQNTRKGCKSATGGTRKFIPNSTTSRTVVRNTVEKKNRKRWLLPRKTNQNAQKKKNMRTAQTWPRFCNMLLVLWIFRNFISEYKTMSWRPTCQCPRKDIVLLYGDLLQSAEKGVTVNDQYSIVRRNCNNMVKEFSFFYHVFVISSGNRLP